MQKDALNSSKGLKTTVTVCSDGVPFDFVQQNLRIKFWVPSIWYIYILFTFLLSLLG
jgi:hypothetical protein